MQHGSTNQIFWKSLVQTTECMQELYKSIYILRSGWINLRNTELIEVLKMISVDADIMDVRGWNPTSPYTNYNYLPICALYLRKRSSIQSHRLRFIQAQTMHYRSWLVQSSYCCVNYAFRCKKLVQFEYIRTWPRRAFSDYAHGGFFGCWSQWAD